MKNRGILFLGLVISMMFILSCVNELSDREFEEELLNLTEEEVGLLDKGNIIGEASLDSGRRQKIQSISNYITKNNPAITCVDSDGGLSYKKKGLVTFKSSKNAIAKTYQDGCSSNLLNEYYCVKQYLRRFFEKTN